MRSSILPYHVTARVNNREAFHLPPAKMWQLFVTEILIFRLQCGVEIQAFVMMPNHFHMILTTPEMDLGESMNWFMSQITLTSNAYSRRSGHLFSGPHFRSLIESPRYYTHVLKYVYRNPVKAGATKSVESYKYSTLNGLVGNSRLLIPIHMTRAGFESGLPHHEPYDQLAWLNQPFPHEAEYLIRRGLRKSVFSVPLDRTARRSILLMDQLI